MRSKLHKKFGVCAKPRCTICQNILVPDANLKLVPSTSLCLDTWHDDFPSRLAKAKWICSTLASGLSLVLTLTCRPTHFQN